MTENKHCMYHLVLESSERNTFNRLYPKLMKTFLLRCINLANNDPKFFESVFLNDRFRSDYGVE